MIFGRYLNVRPWSPDFSASNNEMDMQVVWVRLPELPESYYADCLLRVISQAIGTVVKIDDHTSSGRRGRFARLAVCVDLRKPLVSKLKISGHTQKVEYESLPVVCFNCGIFRHHTEICKGSKENSTKGGVGGFEPSSGGME